MPQVIRLNKYSSQVVESLVAGEVDAAGFSLIFTVGRQGLIDLYMKMAADTDGAVLFIGPCAPLFSLNGLYSGPRLVVTGPEPLVRVVADMFWDRRDLATIRGSLVLRSDGPDPAFDLPDETLAIDGDVETARFAFLQILGRMTALGMISGRGVPLRWVA